ncbi:MAG TPA: vitamin K epoxide reductase family protein [Candidatus Kapabacteria bacterium]|nr:vitamin K epoxide reductase family protein [Candidatus Kapabacteria bacterium]
MMTSHIATLVVAFAGFVITAAFVRKVRTEQDCGERGYCTLVSETKQGRFFFVKNTTVGFIFYLFLIAIEVLQILQVPLPVLVPIYEQTAIWIAAGMSFYLFYQLLFVLGQRCPLCIAAHAVNGILALLVVLAK